MNIKNFLKPDKFNATIFVFISLIFLYFAHENVSAAGFGFAFFYNAYGFPFQYLITGETSNLSGITSGMFLGNHFAKLGKVLVNPATFIINLILIYLLACAISVLFSKIKNKHKNS